MKQKQLVLTYLSQNFKGRRERRCEVGDIARLGFHHAVTQLSHILQICLCCNRKKTIRHNYTLALILFRKQNKIISPYLNDFVFETGNNGYGNFTELVNVDKVILGKSVE